MIDIIKEADLKDLTAELWFRLRKKHQIVWTLDNGNKISIKKMSDIYLLKTIAMLEDQLEENKETLED